MLHVKGSHRNPSSGHIVAPSEGLTENACPLGRPGILTDSRSDISKTGRGNSQHLRALVLGSERYQILCLAGPEQFAVYVLNAASGV